MFVSVKKSKRQHTLLSVIGVSLFMVCTSAHAGLFDAISNGLGSLKDKISSGSSADSKPLAACEAEAKTACEAVTDFYKKNPDWKPQSCDLAIPANEINAAGNNVKALTELRDKSKKLVDQGADEAKQDFSNHPADERAVIKPNYAYHLCAAKAYGDAIEALKGPDPATFKAVAPSVTVVDSAGLPKTKKVILGNFVMDFQDQYIKTKNGIHFMGMGSFDRNVATNSVTLPDAATLQALTDFAYLRVQEKLREQGYEVVLPAQLSGAARTAQEKLLADADKVESGQAMETWDGTSILYTPTGVTSVMTNNCDYGHSSGDHKSIGEKLAGIGKNFSDKSSSPALERKLAKAEGAPLLKVWITVGFGDVEANGAGSFISFRQKNYTTGSVTTTVANGANAKATTGMFLRPGATRFSFTNPGDSIMNCNCGISLTRGSKVPADGEALIALSDKYRDDGSEVVSLSNHAASIGVTDTAIGGNSVARSVKENDDGSRAKTAGTGQVQLTNLGSSTSGFVDTREDMSSRTQLNTRSNYATAIRSDYYATSVINMVEGVTSAFIEKMK